VVEPANTDVDAGAILLPSDPAGTHPWTLRSITQRTIGDVKELSTAPLQWKRREWTRFGEGLALVGAVYLADDKILNAVQRNRRGATDRYLNAVTHLGGGAGENVAVLLLASGLLTHNDALRDTGFDALESSVLAAGVVTPVIKRVAGRARPNDELGKHHFEPLSHYESFPSGHSTNAWAVATAIAEHSDNRAVPILCYTLATSVSLARVNSNVHFPSDVVAGALIGHAIAKSVTRRHLGPHTRLTVVPNGRGLVAVLHF